MIDDIRIRAELGDRDPALAGRFIEALQSVARAPKDATDGRAIADQFQDICDVCWKARDYPQVAAILTHIQAAAADAPNADYRARLADVMRHFVSPERLSLVMFDFIGGALPVAVATRFWEFAPDDVMWPILLDTWSRIPDGESRTIILGALRNRIATNMDLLRQTLHAPEPSRIRAALALLDERIERMFAAELIALASHEDESIRRKGIAAREKFST